jgi:hypothetical protein
MPIATRAIKCYRVFNWESNRWVSMYRAWNWGTPRVGMTMEAHAARNNEECTTGVHAWKQFNDLPKRGGRAVWLAVVPKGTWYHRGANKLREDKLVLVRRLTKKDWEAANG